MITPESLINVRIFFIFEFRPILESTRQPSWREFEFIYDFKNPARLLEILDLKWVSNIKILITDVRYDNAEET